MWRVSGEGGGAGMSTQGALGRGHHSEANQQDPCTHARPRALLTDRLAAAVLVMRGVARAELQAAQHQHLGHQRLAAAGGRAVHEILAGFAALEGRGLPCIHALDSLLSVGLQRGVTAAVAVGGSVGVEQGFEEAGNSIMQRWGGAHLDDPRGKPPLGQVQAQGAPLRWRLQLMPLRWQRRWVRVRGLQLLGRVLVPGRSRAGPGGHCSLLGSRWHVLGARTLLRLLWQLSERRPAGGVGCGVGGGSGSSGAISSLFPIICAPQEQVAHSTRWLRHPSGG